MLPRILCLGLLLFLPVEPASAEIGDAKLVDLTYALDEHNVFWPSNKPFTWEKSSWGTSAQGYWYASAEFAMSEHGGTHIDAPIHFAEGKQAVDEIPLQRLIAPAVVIDVQPAVAGNRDYRLSRQDLEAWETRHGPIQRGAVVLMLTGWGQGWPDKSRYLGSATPSDPTTLHFPGFSK
ncbi:MAG TPA: cyclase family protein, partial [Nitrospira sp.]|nr:cyclase family protein [Nitrospira sp.]